MDIMHVCLVACKAAKIIGTVMLLINGLLLVIETGHGDGIQAGRILPLLLGSVILICSGWILESSFTDTTVEQVSQNMTQPENESAEVITNEVKDTGSKRGERIAEWVFVITVASFLSVILALVLEQLYRLMLIKKMQNFNLASLDTKTLEKLRAKLTELSTSFSSYVFSFLNSNLELTATAETFKLIYCISKLLDERTGSREQVRIVAPPDPQGDDGIKEARK